ncbi:hypothetical protein [Paenarthrobacter aurescens]|uniref:hypothetical protein n=1 Tax=Paenarthrobacter aurescens TaxID=43663 RepID=UPI0021C04AC6|nr:hypothetical protein [Paenarthrobacter aurescens]MCT9868135.1 hypothetical protein [Paenarthrobacter aurescens]
MTLNETIARIRAAHLMVRDAREWDGLTTGLLQAYGARDEDLIEQLQPPFLQSWRTVTRYVLRDTFDAAGISVADPGHHWGIAALTANGVSREPLLCRMDPAAPEDAAGSATDGPQLLTFAEAMTYYAECLAPLLEHAGHQEQYSR